ncbi:MAG: RAP domain-containing protein, partial [Chloroflexi bacterium]|nr:RAP domain-containing protein [Chloroflexota bacterium]
SHTHMARIGHRGALETARRHPVKPGLGGYGMLFRIVRQWRLEHPSSHERDVMSILADLGATDYEREAQPLGEDVLIAVDFCFWGQHRRCPQRIIEVNGRVHYDPLFDHPNVPHTRRENEARRLRKLERAGWQVLTIHYQELADRAAVRRRIAAFLELDHEPR